MADGLEGLTDLMIRMRGLPEKLQNRTLIGWTTMVANRLASRLRQAVRPVAFRTGRMVGAIRGARVAPKKARSIFQSIARAIAFGSKRHSGYAWGLINAGTKPRFATVRRGQSTGRWLRKREQDADMRPAYRGRGPRMNLVHRFGPAILQQVLPEAEKELAKRIERAFAKNGGGE